MRASSATSAFRHQRQIAIAPATPWDIFFLAGEVAIGSRLRHFAAELSSPKGQRTLTLKCAKAILGRSWGIRRLVKPTQFLAARIGSETVGAVFAHSSRDADGGWVAVLEFLVVHREFRRLGVGETLIRQLAVQAPCPDAMRCWCAPQSYAMKCLLRSEGFKRVLNPIQIDQRLMMPSLWEYRCKPAPMAAAQHERKHIRQRTAESAVGLSAETLV